MTYFNMQLAKSVRTFLAKHFKLYDKLSWQTKEEEHISHVPYSSIVKNIMYAMICTRLKVFLFSSHKKGIS